MSETESKKVCYVCGADVTHSGRARSRYGEYLCAKCAEVKRQSSKRRTQQHARKKTRRVILVVLLAAAASWLFLRLLAMLNQLRNPDS